MKFQVSFSLEAVEDIVRAVAASHSKAAAANATRQIRSALESDPAAFGEHLREGLWFIDRDPLRAFYTKDDETATVEIVSVKLL